MAAPEGPAAVEERFGAPQLRIPKERVPVRVLLDGGERIAGDLFVSRSAARHLGRERVADLLRGGERFLPFRGESGPELLGRDRIVAVEVRSAGEAGIDPPDAGERECPVRVELAGVPAARATYEGVLRVAMPAGRERPVDVLNTDDPWIGLVTSEGAVLVSKRYVRRVVTGG
ncbi:MAG: hypothetical protein D6718_05015 [Acidobacteria bacterium]|nr:MAG: hypothetical protein D6718_05015 [Acidobacteriota bacterium]